MSDPSRSVLPYRDAPELAAEVRRRRVWVGTVLGVAAILVLALGFAFISFRRAALAERAAVAAENQALRAELQQLKQQQPQRSAGAPPVMAAPPGTTQSPPPAAAAATSAAAGNGEGAVAPLPEKVVAQGPANGAADSALPKLVRATSARVEGRHAEAARLTAEAFAADGDLADDLEAGHRYLAACEAALAAAGKGEDAMDLTPDERGRLRKQALSWLRDDLKARAAAPPFKRDELLAPLKTWTGDGDLSSVRDASALLGLPADEQQAWKAFWADVAGELSRLEREREEK